MSASTKAVVEAMRADFADMAADPANADRALLRMAAAYERWTVQLARIASLRETEMRALLVIWDGGRVPMTEIGARLGVARATVTPLVDSLATRGLAERVPNPSDRRHTLVGATMKGDRLLREWSARAADAAQEVGTSDPERWREAANVNGGIRAALLKTSEVVQAEKFPAPQRPAEREIGESATGW